MQVDYKYRNKALLFTVLAVFPGISTVSANPSMVLGAQVASPLTFALGKRQVPTPLLLASLTDDAAKTRHVSKLKQLSTLSPKEETKSWRERDRESLASLQKSLSDSERLRWADRGGHNRVVETALSADELADLLIYDEQLRAAEPGKLSHDADWLDLPNPMYGPLTEVVDPIETFAAPRVKKHKRLSSGPAVTPNHAPTVSSQHVLDPWDVPIGADLQRSKTLGAAMQRLLSLVGFRLVIEGPSVDRRSTMALSMPVPSALHNLRANNLRDALVALAGPGLTVVVDHAQRAVAVDVNPGQLPLLTNVSN